MSALSSIFLGVNPQQARNTIAEYIRHGEWKTFAQPFCGRFGLSEAIARTVGSSENLWTSDICVFSAIAGYYLSDQPLDKLGFRVLDEKLSFLFQLVGGEDERAAAMLLVVKYAQLKRRKPYYYQCAAKEILVNAEKYIQRLAAQLRKVKEVLNGLHFRLLDYKDEIKQHMDNPDALIICDPPCYEKGYTNMFDPGDSYSWNEPKIPEFKPAEFDKALSSLEGDEAKLFVAPIKNWPGFREAVNKVMAEEDIRSIGTAVARMSEIILNHYGADKDVSK